MRGTVVRPPRSPTRGQQDHPTDGPISPSAGPRGDPVRAILAMSTGEVISTSAGSFEGARQAPNSHAPRGEGERRVVLVPDSPLVGLPPGAEVTSESLAELASDIAYL